jgi:UDP-N-acetylmuramate--alanine ligase
LYSRTNDFSDAFAESLDMLDETILLDIYPAREKPIKGVTSQMLLNKMKSEKKQLVKMNDLVDFVKNKKIEVLMTLGAGDIDTLVEPLEKALMHK